MAHGCMPFALALIADTFYRNGTISSPEMKCARNMVDEKAKKKTSASASYKTRVQCSIAPYQEGNANTYSVRYREIDKVNLPLGGSKIRGTKAGISPTEESVAAPSNVRLDLMHTFR